MDWRKMNGRDRGPIDGIGYFLQGPTNEQGVTGPTGPAGGGGGGGGGDGPTGPTGPASTVTGPTGPASTVTGPTGPASTVTGPTGPASTVTGPTGPAGTAGVNSITPGNYITVTNGNPTIPIVALNVGFPIESDMMLSSTMAGALSWKSSIGYTGPTGPASTVIGPTGPTGPKGDNGGGSSSWVSTATSNLNMSTYAISSISQLYFSGGDGLPQDTAFIPSKLLTPYISSQTTGKYTDKVVTNSFELYTLNLGHLLPVNSYLNSVNCFLKLDILLKGVCLLTDLLIPLILTVSCVSIADDKVSEDVVNYYENKEGVIISSYMTFYISYNDFNNVCNGTVKIVVSTNAASTSETFTANTIYTPPPTVSTVTIEAVGGAGGGYPIAGFLQRGGHGGSVTRTLTNITGPINITIGGGGYAGGNAFTPNYSQGGTNGGGNGGIANNGFGGGGGGYTMVTGTIFGNLFGSNFKFIAGGGGGAQLLCRGGDGCFQEINGFGGDGQVPPAEGFIVYRAGSLASTGIGGGLLFYLAPPSLYTAGASGIGAGGNAPNGTNETGFNGRVGSGGGGGGWGGGSPGGSGHLRSIPPPGVTYYANSSGGNAGGSAFFLNNISYDNDVTFKPGTNGNTDLKGGDGYVIITTIEPKFKITYAPVSYSYVFLNP